MLNVPVRIGLFSVGPLLSTTLPEPVEVVVPVPPLVTPSVPASVIAPPVAEDGVRPESDVWNDETPVTSAESCETLTASFGFTPLARFVSL